MPKKKELTTKHPDDSLESISWWGIDYSPRRTWYWWAFYGWLTFALTFLMILTGHWTGAAVAVTAFAALIVLRNRPSRRVQCKIDGTKLTAFKQELDLSEYRAYIIESQDDLHADTAPASIYLIPNKRLRMGTSFPLSTNEQTNVRIVARLNELLIEERDAEMRSLVIRMARWLRF